MFVCDTGLLETYFIAFPNSAVNEDLMPSPTHIALVVVTGDEVPAEVIAKQVARRCSASPNWKRKLCLMMIQSSWFRFLLLRTWTNWMGFSVGPPLAV
jgi:hypothetical protein